MARINKSVRISDRLRDAILTSERSRYRLAKDSGVTEAALSRFVRGERSLSLESVDALCEALGLELVGHRKSKGT